MMSDGGVARCIRLAGQIELSLKVGGPGNLVECPASSSWGPACPCISESSAREIASRKRKTGCHIP